MIEIYKIPLPKDKLTLLSTEERSLLFLLGYADNQILLFRKLITFATNTEASHPIEQHITGASTQMLVRTIIGVLNETWRTIHERFISKRLGRDYEPLLDQSGREALKNLKRHFSKPNLINKIRNDFAYHHPTDTDVDAAFRAASADKDRDADWNWYFSRSALNSFYFACDIVILYGILNATGETDLIKAQEKILKEVSLVSDLMRDFIPSFIAAVWLKHFGKEMPAEISLKVKDAPEIWNVVLPFFVQMTGPKEPV